MKRAAEIARAANRDAARVLREEERQRLPHTAADDALRQEEGKGAAAAEGTDDSDADRREEALGAEQDRTGPTWGPRAPNARRRGAWSGKNWAREAWTGPIAAMEYAEAWREGPLPRPPKSAAAHSAQRAAQRRSHSANAEGHAHATATAARETARRTSSLWGAAADAKEANVRQGATEELKEMVRRWQTREAIELPPQGIHLTYAQDTARVASEAADALQRKRPATDKVAAAARKRALVDTAQMMTATGALQGLTGGNDEERARQVLQLIRGESASSTFRNHELEEVVRLMTTVLECLPCITITARDEPMRDVPMAAQQVRGRTEGVNEPPSADGSAARERVPQPLPHTTIHVGNLRANGRTAPWRPENTEDRRVDRGTPLGNPFPIDPSDDHEREAACTAYAELIRSELTHANVQEIAARYELRVDQRYALPTATQALRHALHRLERDVMELQPGRSIRLMCHCTPKHCHAHVIAHEIRCRLRTRGIYIEVDDGGWERPEERGDAGSNAGMEDEGADASMDEEASHATAQRADPGAPSHAPADMMNASPTLAECWIDENKERNERAYEEFMIQMATEAAATAVEATTATALSAKAVTEEASRRKSTTATTRKRAAVATAAAARAARAARATAATETGTATTEAATRASVTAAAAATATGDAVTGAAATAAVATATGEATAKAVTAEAAMTAAAEGGDIDRRDTDNSGVTARNASEKNMETAAAGATTATAAATTTGVATMEATTGAAATATTAAMAPGAAETGAGVTAERALVTGEATAVAVGGGIERKETDNSGVTKGDASSANMETAGSERNESDEDKTRDEEDGRADGTGRKKRNRGRRLNSGQRQVRADRRSATDEARGSRAGQSE